MSELLPCPFCGGEAELQKTYDMRTNKVDGYFVWCDNKECECEPETNEHFTEAEAIDAWNTRTERVGERKTINKTGDFATHDTRAERTCKADYRSGGYGIGGWYCSECGGYMHDDMQQDMAYCPNCGAKVVGE